MSVNLSVFPMRLEASFEVATATYTSGDQPLDEQLRAGGCRAGGTCQADRYLAAFHAKDGDLRHGKGLSSRRRALQTDEVHCAVPWRGSAGAVW
jgi:hypothetical protein